MKTIRQLRKRLLSIFLTGFIVLFLVLILQTYSGKYRGLVYIPWLWFILLYIGPILVLYQIKERTKKINAPEIVILSGLFVLGTLLVIVLQPFAASGQNRPTYLAYGNILKTSALFLIPLELLLVYLYHKKLYRKQAPGVNVPFIDQDARIFISYNHNDREVAFRIKEALEKEDIDVIIDEVDMIAGTAIKEFIENSISEATVTVSLVSNKSLRSAWVAMETIDTFFLEKYRTNKKFIACYLDDDFFQSDFTLKTITEIDKQIEANQKLIRGYQKKKLDTRDLNNQNTRLLALRNNLDAIVGRLKDSKCLDVREESFGQSIQKLIDAIYDDS